MEHNDNGGNNAVIAVLVLVVIVIVGWFAYRQGYLGGAGDNKQDIEINLPDMPGASEAPKP